MHRLSGIVTGMLLVGALGVLAGGVALYSGNLRLQVVTSGSMRPTISPGDVAVTTPIPIATLAVGDVIAFFPPGEGRPVLHRIATLEPDPAGPLITTKGDANNVADPWHATLRGDDRLPPRRGRPVRRLPGRIPRRRADRRRHS